MLAYMTRSAAQWLEQQQTNVDEALEALVSLNSYSANRAGGQRVADVLQKYFSIPGLHCERVVSEQYADHLVFRSEGEGAPLALLGHLDTVFPPGTFEGYRREGELRFGPGVLDMKGGLLVVAWALKAVAQTVGLGKAPPLRIVIVADEEVGSPEGGPLIERVITGCSAALVFESGRANDAIVTQRKGTGNATLLAHGRAAHAGNAYTEGINAIHALARVIDKAQQLTRVEEGVTVNVGLVEGGSAKNTVPQHARAEVDLRYEAKAQSDALWEQLRHAATAHGVEGARVEVVTGPGRPPMERLPGTQALLEKYAACARQFGLDAQEAPRQGGGSDGNTSAALGIPTIDALGPRGRFFHTHDEYIEFPTLLKRAQALAQFLLT